MSVLEQEKLTDQIIKSRRAFDAELGYYMFLEKGGMALADHRGETLRQRQKAVIALDSLNYFERLAGLPETPNAIPTSKYEELS